MPDVVYDWSKKNAKEMAKALGPLLEGHNKALQSSFDSLAKSMIELNGTVKECAVERAEAISTRKLEIAMSAIEKTEKTIGTILNKMQQDIVELGNDTVGSIEETRSIAHEETKAKAEEIKATISSIDEQTKAALGKLNDAVKALEQSSAESKKALDAYNELKDKEANERDTKTLETLREKIEAAKREWLEKEESGRKELRESIEEIRGIIGNAMLLFKQLDGRGLPPGGKKGMILVKASNDDYDTNWEFIVIGAPSNVGGGGTGAVSSVNGKTGAIVLTPEDIGADAAGTAAEAIIAHVAEENPHSQYLQSLAVNGLSDVDSDSISNYDVIAFDVSDSTYKPFRSLDATGFENRTDSTATVNGDNIEIAKTGTSFNVFVGGRRLNYTTTQTADISTDVDETFVYFDSDGIKSSTTAWDISGYSAPAYITYRNNAITPAVVLFDERHSYLRDRAWHEWAHDTIGCRYASGLAGTFGNTTFSIATGEVHDEDLHHMITQTATAGRLWYRHTGATAMAWVENRTLPYAGTSSQAQYDNGGTLASVGQSKFFNTWVYMTNAATYPVGLVVGQSQYDTIAQARNASLPTFPSLGVREWKLLYRATFQQGSGTVTYVEARDFREVSTGPGSNYTAASHTNLTNRDATASHPATAISVDATPTNYSAATSDVEAHLAGIDAALGSSGSGFNWATENEVTDDASPATSDMGERYIFMPATAAAKTVTLPSMGESEDGDWIAITNASPYMIYVTAADTDYIGWPALKVLSIEILPNTHIVLRYDHSRTRWDIVFKSGAGQVRPKGAVLYLPCDESWMYFNSSVFMTPNQANALTNLQLYNGGYPGAPYLHGNFGACVELDGTNDYGAINDSADWDVFGATTGAVTVCGWVYCDRAVGTTESICVHYEDANNRWQFYRNSAGGNLGIYVVSGGIDQMNIAAGTLSQSTWHHIALVRVGAETGIYLDGTQVAYDATFTADTFSGSLYFGQLGNGSQYFDGRLDDWAIVHSNIFGAAPNSTPNDTITIDTLNPLGLVL